MSEEFHKANEKAQVRAAKDVAERILGDGAADSEEPVLVTLNDGKTVAMNRDGSVVDLGVDETRQN